MRWRPISTEQSQAHISLIADVATGYLALRRQRLLRPRNTANSQRESYNLTKRSYELGDSSAQDLAQAETSVKSRSRRRQIHPSGTAECQRYGCWYRAAGLADNATLNNNWRFPPCPQACHLTC
jgi:multidrug efflux system outer membrane protein